MCENLRIWGDEETVVTMSLKVMRDLTSGYEYSKLLLRLDSVTNVLTNQTVGTISDWDWGNYVIHL